MQRSARIVKAKEKYAYGMQIEAKRMRINETIEKTKKKNCLTAKTVTRQIVCRVWSVHTHTVTHTHP